MATWAVRPIKFMLTRADVAIILCMPYRQMTGALRMAKRPTNKVKMKVWTERSTAEMEGQIKDSAYYLFMFVPENEREQLLIDMAEWHKKAGAITEANKCST